ncbi:unnamed protein product [Periconia digitata]|uniref:Uncharacterized protein n=1 Tax=Periconia digitata TaxID=1303443 RepID=A0A9W4U2Y4_9PLEO|nr:unnamed protein product [Periconia digitata]
MSLGSEGIVAVVAVAVACPPAAWVIYKAYRHRSSSSDLKMISFLKSLFY